MVLAGQIEILEKQQENGYFPNNHRSNAAVGSLIQNLKNMVPLQCTICGLRGHDASYCWLNGQLFRLASRDQDCLAAYKVYRAVIKSEAKIASKVQQRALAAQVDDSIIMGNPKSLASTLFK